MTMTNACNTGTKSSVWMLRAMAGAAVSGDETYGMCPSSSRSTAGTVSGITTTTKSCHRWTHFPLATSFLFILLVQSLINQSSASMPCTTDPDCTVKGDGNCKVFLNGERACSYASCAAGYYGASASYTDCHACPEGTTSLAGKAFYASDCFLECGMSRCYIPDGGSAECEAASVASLSVCAQYCDETGYTIKNPTKPYATCVLGSKQPITKSSPGRAVFRDRSQQDMPAAMLNRAYKRFPDLIEALPIVARDGPADQVQPEEVQQSKVPLKAKVTKGRRIRKTADLHAGPAVAMLENAGRDPLALVSK